MSSESPSQATASRPAGAAYRAEYHIRVQGCLDDHWAGWFEGLTLTRDVAQGTTTLAGPVPDQAALHGILAQIRDLGLTLVSLTRLEMDAESR